MKLRKIYKSVLAMLACGLVLYFAKPSFETGNPYGTSAVVLTLLGLTYMAFQYTILNDWPSYNYRVPVKVFIWTVLFGLSAWVLSWSTVSAVLYLRDMITYVTAGLTFLTFLFFSGWFQDWLKYGIH